MDLITQIVVIAALVVAFARAGNQLLAKISGITSTTRDDEISHFIGVWIRRIQSVLDTVSLKPDADKRTVDKQRG